MKDNNIYDLQVLYNDDKNLIEVIIDDQEIEIPMEGVQDAKDAILKTQMVLGVNLPDDLLTKPLVHVRAVQVIQEHWENIINHNNHE